MADITQVQTFNKIQYNIKDDNAPRKDGTGATGTWGISITGNAGTATADANGDTFTTIYAKLVSPTFTGTPTAPTATTGTNTTQIATTAFVQAAIAATLNNILYDGSSTDL